MYAIHAAPSRTRQISNPATPSIQGRPALKALRPSPKAQPGAVDLTQMLADARFSGRFTKATQSPR